MECLEHTRDNYGKHRVAIVTGAGHGIGRAIARLFAKEGAAVVVNYNRSEKEAGALAEEIKQEDGIGLLVKADVSKADEVKNMVQKTVRRFGRIDILVNNAGIRIRQGFLDSADDNWSRTMDINLKSAYLCSREVAQIMLKQEKGKIINISSVSGLAQPSALFYVEYAVSKAGMIGLTRSLVVSLAPNINVNAICPGNIETDMEASHTPETKMMIKETPLKRFGTPEEIAGAALFLASDESGFITGEILTVAGGRGMR